MSFEELAVVLSRFLEGSTLEIAEIRLVRIVEAIGTLVVEKLSGLFRKLQLLELEAREDEKDIVLFPLELSEFFGRLPPPGWRVDECLDHRVQLGGDLVSNRLELIPQLVGFDRLAVGPLLGKQWSTVSDEFVVKASPAALLLQVLWPLRAEISCVARQLQCR
ncbi:hypothetical protein [Mesorhizobium sp. M0199]|uniref:hypothetical protein n=1 Tax=Mesorhizobium sp. M0199 TaxID=2956911 RepID=UPI00333CDC53